MSRKVEARHLAVSVCPGFQWDGWRRSTQVCLYFSYRLSLLFSSSPSSKVPCKSDLFILMKDNFLKYCTDQGEAV